MAKEVQSIGIWFPNLHNIAPAFTNLNQIIHEIKSCQILLHNMVKGIIPVALQQQHNLISYIISSAKLDRIQRSTLCSIQFLLLSLVIHFTPVQHSAIVPKLPLKEWYLQKKESTQLVTLPYQIQEPCNHKISIPHKISFPFNNFC